MEVELTRQREVPDLVLAHKLIESFHQRMGERGLHSERLVAAGAVTDLSLRLER